MNNNDMRKVGMAMRGFFKYWFIRSLMPGFSVMEI